MDSADKLIAKETSADSESLALLGQQKSYPKRARRLNDTDVQARDCIVGLLWGKR